MADEKIKHSAQIERMKQIISLYDTMVFGDDSRYGMEHCIDGYYSGCWDDLQVRIEAIKEQLKNNNNEELS